MAGVYQIAKSTKRIALAIRPLHSVVNVSRIWPLLLLILAFDLCKTEGASYRTTPSLKMSPAQNAGAKQLVSGSLITQEISSNEFHEYQIHLKQGQYFCAVLTEGDLNIRVTVYRPTGPKC